jgi:hypothetical protein
MEKVVSFCLKNEIIEKEASVGFGHTGDPVALRFDPHFIEKVAGGQ